MIRNLLPLVLVLVASCTNITPVDQQFSGYLDDYSNLEPVDMSDGSKAMRWYSPTAKDKGYTKVIVKQVEFYPEPQPSEQVTKDKLLKLSQYMTQRLKDELSQDFEIVTEPGPNVFSLQFAITGVETPTEGLQAINAIPVSMVIAGVSAAAGERDHVVVLYIEGQSTDSTTGEVLAKGVRQGVGKNLKNDAEQLSVEHLKDLINGWAKEIAALSRQIKPA